MLHFFYAPIIVHINFDHSISHFQSSDLDTRFSNMSPQHSDCLVKWDMSPPWKYSAQPEIACRASNR